jgi:hypothetical protein
LQLEGAMILELFSAQMREAVSTIVGQVMLEIALGKPVDGAPQPADVRMRLLRHLRRAWDRGERQRCARIRDEADRAGYVAAPQPRPWPGLERLDDRLVDVALAIDLRWRRHFLLDPFSPLSARLADCRARARSRSALRIALAEIDSAFPSTSPRRSS